MIKIYHASLAPNISEFRPLSHFGERDSSLAAAASKYFAKENLVERRDAWMYEIELDASEEALLDSKDAGSPNAFSILGSLKTGLESKKEFINGACKALTFLLSHDKTGDQVHNVALDLINWLISREGKSVIRYKNEVEDDGSYSYCIPDCSNLGFGAPTRLSFEELRRGYSLLGFSRQSHLIDPDRWLERVEVA